MNLDLYKEIILSSSFSWPWLTQETDEIHPINRAFTIIMLKKKHRLQINNKVFLLKIAACSFPCDANSGRTSSQASFEHYPIYLQSRGRCGLPFGSQTQGSRLARSDILHMSTSTRNTPKNAAGESHSGGFCNSSQAQYHVADNPVKNPPSCNETCCRIPS